MRDVKTPITLKQNLYQAVTLWQTIPGVERVTACNLVAELGVNMNQFPSAQHLASWAALCPGNHESAGKRKSGKTRDGNKWLRRSLCLAARRGAKRAVIAVSHTILIIAFHILKSGQGYHELGGNYLEQINKDQLQRYCVKRLERLGLKVTLEPAIALA